MAEPPIIQRPAEPTGPQFLSTVGGLADRYLNEGSRDKQRVHLQKLHRDALAEFTTPGGANRIEQVFAYTDELVAVAIAELRVEVRHFHATVSDVYEKAQDVGDADTAAVNARVREFVERLHVPGTEADKTPLFL